jgi:hypothetical protein
MQARFISKLESLKDTLKDWNARERSPFDTTNLSEEVQALLVDGDGERTKFMHLRTVTSGAGRRKSVAGGDAERTGVAGMMAFPAAIGEEDEGEAEAEEPKAEEKKTVSRESVAAALAAAEKAAQVATAAQPQRKTRSRAASLAAYKLSTKNLGEEKRGGGGGTKALGEASGSGSGSAGGAKLKNSDRRNTIAISTPAKSKREAPAKSKAMNVFGSLLNDTPTKENREV